MKFGQPEKADLFGKLKVLDHCSLRWRQRAGQGARIAEDGAQLCPTCLRLVKRFGPLEGLLLDESAAPPSGQAKLADWKPGFVRQLKDEAALAVERRRHLQAAALFLHLATLEPSHPDWPHRAGEALRNAGNVTLAARQFAVAAECYAWAGAFAKAQAACKVALLLDPACPEPRELLATLGKNRDEFFPRAGAVGR